MTWTVGLSVKANRQKSRLPVQVRDKLLALLMAIKASGPVQPSMPHFGKLKGRDRTYHCHLNKGKPRYVAVWQVKDKTIQLVEVTYVGTHENAPY